MREHEQVDPRRVASNDAHFLELLDSLAHGRMIIVSLTSRREFICVLCFLCPASAIPAPLIGNHCGRQNTLTSAASFSVIGIVLSAMSGSGRWITPCGNRPPRRFWPRIVWAALRLPTGQRDRTDPVLPSCSLPCRIPTGPRSPAPPLALPRCLRRCSNIT